MCGEQPPFMAVGQSAGGSPPRVRGTAPGRRTTGLPPGITPACAGNRLFNKLGINVKKDHPRVCGEQTMQCLMRHMRDGSPPRVRGTAPGAPAPPFPVGITPACAGNRACTLPGRAIIRDHPRVCGEQLLLPKRRLPRTGSPPRVRGTGLKWPHAFPGCRITPACAGNSIFTRPQIVQYRDHPRVCGEQRTSG